MIKVPGKVFSKSWESRFQKNLNIIKGINTVDVLNNLLALCFIFFVFLLIILL